MSEESEIDMFKYLESTMDNVELPKLPDEQMEWIVESAIDPIVGAKAIQLYAESQSPDAHKYIIRKYNNLLNYIFMAEYLNSPVTVRVEDEFGMPDAIRFADMGGLLFELGEKGEVRAGGKMGYFEDHYYTDQETNITRPILSLRLHSSSYVNMNNDGGKVIGIPNYTTIPVTAITDYTIKSKVEE